MENEQIITDLVNVYDINQQQVEVLIMDDRPDINNWWDFSAYLLLMIANILLIVRVLINFFKMRIIRKQKLKYALNFLKCVNSNILLGAIVRQSLFIYAVVFFFDKNIQQSKNNQMAYDWIQDFNVYLLCLLMIIVSKQWITVWLKSKMRRKRRIAKILRIFLSFLWIFCLLMLIFINVAKESMNDQYNKFMRYYIIFQIFICTSIQIFSLIRLQRHISQMQAVDRVIKRNLNLSIYVVIIACLLRILINMILAVNPVWEWYQEERGFPIQAIFSLLIYLGGDMLPCFFFAIMFSPQLEKNIFKRAKLPKFNQQHFQSSAFTDSMISFVAGDDDEDDEQIDCRLLDAELGFQE